MARKPRLIPRPPPIVPGAVLHSPIRLFVDSDIQQLWCAASPRGALQLNKSTTRRLVDLLNEGVNAFIVESRMERFAAAGVATKWNAEISTTARELLAALGVRPLYPPHNFDDRPPIEGEISSDTIFALVSEPNGTELRQHLGLPKSFNDAVRHSIGAIWWLAQVSGAAARMHDVAKKRDPKKRRKRTVDALTSRQQFLLRLAKTYEALLKRKIPQSPYAAATPHPFIRFCLAAFRVGATRIDEAAARINDTEYQLQVADIEAVKGLAKTNAAAIRDDVRNRVHDPLNRKRP